MKRAFIIALIISFLMLTFLNGCSRKVVNTKSLEKVDTETTQKAVISETTQDKTNINVVAESNEFEYTPIDNTKPFTINGKIYFNARIKATKSKANTNTVNDITTAKNAVIEAKVKENIVKQTKVKDSKKEDYSILYLMGIAIVLIAGYLYFKFK
tara:strand:- start:1052 stop:1516 length:465 start_codon:yes stop_codon:yes gene_type:complete